MSHAPFRIDFEHLKPTMVINKIGIDRRGYMYMSMAPFVASPHAGVPLLARRQRFGADSWACSVSSATCGNPRLIEGKKPRETCSIDPVLTAEVTCVYVVHCT